MQDDDLIKKLGAMRMHLGPVLSAEYKTALYEAERRIRGLKDAPAILPGKQKLMAHKERVAKYFLK